MLIAHFFFHKENPMNMIENIWKLPGNKVMARNSGRIVKMHTRAV